MRVAAVVTRGRVWLVGMVLYPALQSPVCVFLYLDVLGLCVCVRSSKPDGMEVMASVELWGCTTKGAGVTMIGAALVDVARQTSSVPDWGELKKRKQSVARK